MKCPTPEDNGLHMELKSYQNKIAIFKCDRCGGAFTVGCEQEHLAKLILGERR